MREVAGYDHSVLVEHIVGIGNGLTDHDYATVGTNAAEIAAGLKAEVTVLKRSVGGLEPPSLAAEKSNNAFDMVCLAFASDTPHMKGQGKFFDWQNSSVWKPILC